MAAERGGGETLNTARTQGTAVSALYALYRRIRTLPLFCFKQRFPSEKTDGDGDDDDVAKGAEKLARRSRLGGRRGWRWYKANLKESGANRRVDRGSAHHD